jgi:hypothetical protein
MKMKKLSPRTAVRVLRVGGKDASLAVRWARESIIKMAQNGHRIDNGIFAGLCESLGESSQGEDRWQRIMSARDALDLILSGAEKKKFGRARAQKALRILGLEPPHVGDSPMTEEGTSSEALFRVLSEAREALREVAEIILREEEGQ